MSDEIKKCQICHKDIFKNKYQNHLKYCSDCLKIAKRQNAKRYNQKLKMKRAIEKEKNEMSIKKINDNLYKDISAANKLKISYAKYIADYKREVRNG